MEAEAKVSQALVSWHRLQWHYHCEAEESSHSLLPLPCAGFVCMCCVKIWSDGAGRTSLSSSAGLFQPQKCL